MNGKLKLRLCCSEIHHTHSHYKMMRFSLIFISSSVVPDLVVLCVLCPLFFVSLYDPFNASFSLSRPEIISTHVKTIIYVQLSTF